MVRYTTCRCMFHFLFRAKFILATGENLLCQRARLVYWAQSLSCHSAVVACSVGKAEPRKCSGSCSLPSSLGNAFINKSPDIGCKAGWLTWCNHGPYHWDLGLFPAQGEAQIVFIPIGMVSFWAFAVPCKSLTTSSSDISETLLDASSEREWGMKGQAYDSIVTY